MDDHLKMDPDAAILAAVFPEEVEGIAPTLPAEEMPPVVTAAPKRKRRKRADAPADDDGGEPRQPRPLGFDAERMNEEWALVLMGSKAVIVHEQPDGPIEDRLRIISIDAFKAWFANRFTESVNADGDLKMTTWATRWLTSSKRRQYKGIEFKPGADAEPTEGYLNLWRGFTVEPRQGGSYKIFRDHLLNNLCDGDEELYRWVFAWFAHLLQRPRERIGTALVMRGKMGTGKS